MPRSIDQLLAPDYLAGVEGLAIDVLRQRRQDCQEIESRLSYLRRLTQGRLDIVHAEMSHREQQRPTGDVGDLVERLPEILAARGESRPTTPRGPLPDVVAPPDAGEMADELNVILDADRLGALPSLSGDELRAVAERLSEFERELSRDRRQAHEIIDALQAEIVRRYKSGEATVDALLR
jgi:hypothetical protein